MVFSLRNENNQAVVVPASEVLAGLRIFEQLADSDKESESEELTGLEGLVPESGDGTPSDGPEEDGQARPDGWEEIDYSETSFFVRTAENFEVIFALDFTDSMARARLDDGRNGIDALRDALRATVAMLPSANRVGAVEFHDRNSNPTVLSLPTTKWISVLDAVDEFAASDFDPGSSRLWDALDSIMNTFSGSTEDPDLIKAVIFISDGRDTSNLLSTDEIGDMAIERGIQLYALGLGDVLQAIPLAEMVGSTGGAYYPVEELDDLQAQLQQPVVDLLRGQYRLSYITLRSRGSYIVRLEVTLRGLDAEFSMDPEEDGIDVAEIFAPDTEGRISFDPPLIDKRRAVSSVFVRADHLPRNISRIRFRINSTRPVDFRLATPDEGGLLSGWTVSEPDSEGFYDLSSDEPLEFGNFGLLFMVTIPRLFEDVLEIPVAFDNSIYSPGKRFLYSPVMSFGQPAPD
jgi:Mg-chelatase subunit ChlD